MAEHDPFLASLRDLRELETFLHELLASLTKQKLRHEENVVPYAEKLGVLIPGSLRGLEITWDARPELDGEFGEGDPLVLVRPGNPQALGLTIGCIRISKRIKICLECGWFWCRIVIKGTF